MKNKVIIVTGASSGIGEACAMNFSKRGANLILAARSEEKLKLLCDCIWNNFPEDGWERIVSEKLYNGEDIGWKIKSFSTIFESNLKKCKLKIK